MGEVLEFISDEQRQQKQEPIVRTIIENGMERAEARKAMGLTLEAADYIECMREAVAEYNELDDEYEAVMLDAGPVDGEGVHAHGYIDLKYRVRQ